MSQPFKLTPKRRTATSTLLPTSRLLNLTPEQREEARLKQRQLYRKRRIALKEAKIAAEKDKILEQKNAFPIYVICSETNHYATAFRLYTTLTSNQVLFRRNGQFIKEGVHHNIVIPDSAELSSKVLKEIRAWTNFSTIITKHNYETVLQKYKKRPIPINTV